MNSADFLDLIGLINRNMGCIEITDLKGKNLCFLMINRNMGCIEMRYFWDELFNGRRINRNMGCIEIEAEMEWKCMACDKP